MTNEQFQRVKSVFIAAVEVGEDQRSEVLDRECAGDAEVRHEIEALLAPRRTEQLRTGAACEMAGHDGPKSEPLWHSADDRIGSYRLLENLGTGTFGEVWLAEQENPVRPKVAIKILKPGMDTREVLARFETERRALTMMNHPNVARVSDAGATPQGRPYFVMEYVPGLPITIYCDAARLPIRPRLELFLDICRAVEHAHQKGIIHRDLKPQNILVAVSDGKPVPKVIDFGVAKALAGDDKDVGIATEFGRGVGTLEYMPPEQTGRIDSVVDMRADVYSLGVVLYELLTGTLPLDFQDTRRAGLDSLSAIICESEPPTPSVRLSTLGSQGDGREAACLAAARGSEPRSLRRMLRGELDWIVMRAMEKDRSRRYAAVSGLADDLRRYLSAEPVEAAPPSALYRLGKFVRRNRRSVIPAGLFSIVILAALVGIGLIRTRASRAERAREQLAAQVEWLRPLVRDMLEYAKPSVALGGDTTVLKSVLDNAAERVRRGELRMAPSAELDVRQIIGEAYREIGQLEAAHDMLDITPEMARTIGGSESRLYADAMAIFAILQRDEGRLDESLRNSRQALAIRERIGPEDRAAVAKNIEDVALMLDRVGRVAEALPMHQASLEMRRRLFSSGDRCVGQSLGNTAECLRNLGRTNEALAYQQEALALYRRLPSNERLNVALTLNNIAVCLSDLGRPADAIAPQREALNEFQRLYAGDHEYIISGRNNLAGCLQDIGRKEDALAEYEAALKTATRLYKRDHPNVATCLNNLASCLEALGRRAEAVERYQSALQIQSRLAPENHPALARTLNNLAGALVSLGRLEEAEARYSESAAHAAKGFSENDPRLARIESNYGACMLERGRLVDAEHHLLRAEEIIENAVESPMPHQQENVERLILLYETWGLSDAAQAGKGATWKIRLSELQRTAAGPGTP